MSNNIEKTPMGYGQPSDCGAVYARNSAVSFIWLLIALIVFGAWNPARATILVSDDFPTNGALAGRTPTVGGTWTSISGNLNEMQVVNGYVSLNDANIEDLASGFATVTSGTLFLGFDLIVSDPGAYEGTDFEYFIHFSGASSLFSARTDIAAFSASGFRPGIATTASTAEAVWPVDLAYGTSHRIVIRFDFNTNLASLWVDPSALIDSHIISTTAVTELTIDAVNFRQSSATPDQSLRIGRLRVATTFDEVSLGAVSKSEQTITFANPGAQNFGTTPTLSATSTSGLVVTFTSTTTDVCTITSGGVLTFVNTGTCTIDADQMGNDAYEQAPTVSRSFIVRDTFPSGTGAHDDPYQITNWNHLNDMRNDLAAYYQLANDLTIQTRGYDAHASATANAGQGWLPVGTDESTPFRGALDGQGHTIQGLTINNANNYNGLIGAYQPNFAPPDEAPIQIKNIGLLNVNITGAQDTGALIGYLATPTTFDGDPDFDAKYATVVVQDAFVRGGTVEGTLRVGGLIGYNNNRTVQRIYANAAVTGVDTVGGLVGISLGSIFDCFALGSVQLSSSATAPPNPKGLGGLFGWNGRIIQRCYATGNVGDSDSSGGLFGTTGRIALTNYWDTETTNQQSSAGTVENDPAAEDSGGLSSVQLKTLNQIATTWDFEAVWTITDPATGAIHYPTLRSMPISPAPGLTTTPDIPTLIYPADGSVAVDVAITLTWSDPVLADNFILELETSDGATIVFNGEINRETEKTPPLLQGNTTYRWRVRGINTTHESANPVLGPFSDYATFTTGPRPDEIFSDRFQATGP